MVDSDEVGSIGVPGYLSGYSSATIKNAFVSNARPNTTPPVGTMPPGRVAPRN